MRLTGINMAFLLLMTGVITSCSDDDDVDNPAPLTDFDVSNQEVFVWDEVFFQNQTVNGTAYIWLIEGAVTDSTDNTNVTTRFPDPGSYDVTLIASNGYGTDTLTREDYITVELHTHEFGSFVDGRDDQEYKTIEIGSQTWMAENLNYSYGDAVPYDMMPQHRDAYGLLYSLDDALDACPPGWHLPAPEDLDHMVEYLAFDYVGGIMKEHGSEHWSDNNRFASNASGFSARGAGFYYGEDLGFMNFHKNANFWLTPEHDDQPVYISLSVGDGDLSMSSAGSPEMKFSVRCIQAE